MRKKIYDVFEFLFRKRISEYFDGLKINFHILINAFLHRSNVDKKCMIKCKGCKKPFEKYGRSGISRHIKVAKDCLKAYTIKEVESLAKASIGKSNINSKFQH